METAQRPWAAVSSAGSSAERLFYTSSGNLLFFFEFISILSFPPLVYLSSEPVSVLLITSSHLLAGWYSANILLKIEHRTQYLMLYTVVGEPCLAARGHPSCSLARSALPQCGRAGMGQLMSQGRDREIV